MSYSRILIGGGVCDAPKRTIVQADPRPPIIQPIVTNHNEQRFAAMMQNENLPPIKSSRMSGCLPQI